MNEQIVKSGKFTFPPSYFKKVLRDYSNWRFAFVREILQNSIDAKSKNIVVKVFMNDEGYVVCNVKDDGCGMSSDVLENFYLSFGETNKSSENGDTGGFGVASLLITQPHYSFSVRSHNYICNGTSGNYNISFCDDFVNGVELEIVFDKDTIYDVYPIENNFSIWSSFSNVKNINLIVNDKKIDTNSAKYEYSFDTDIGKLSFSDNEGHYSKIYVRVNNQPMFFVNVTSRNNSSFIGVLDLNKSSQEYLTSNRDSLKQEYAGVLTDVIQSLSFERSKFKINKNVNFFLNEDYFESENNHDLHETNNSSSSSSFSLRKQNNNGLKATNESSESDLEFSIFQKEKAQHEKFFSKFQKRFSSIMDCHYPKTFMISATSYKDLDLLNKPRYYKNAEKWNKICHVLLDALYNVKDKDPNMGYYFNGIYGINKNYKGDFDYYGNRIKTGFTFDSNFRELHYTLENGEMALLLNPCIYFEQNEDLDDMIDLAIHAITHIFNRDHDESYVYNMMKIMRIKRHFLNKKDFI